MLGVLKRLFGRKERRVKLIRLTKEELAGLPDATRIKIGRIIGSLQAENIALRKQLEKMTKKYEKRIQKEREAIVKELFRQQKIIEARKNAKRVVMEFKIKPKIVTYDNKYFHNGKQYFKFLKGLEMEETEDGIGFNLILTDGKKVVRKELGMPLEMIFVNPETLASQIKTGHVRVRIDSKGLYHQPREFSGLQPKTGTEEYYKRLVELKNRFERELTEKDRIISELSHQLRETRKREEKMKTRIMELESTLQILGVQADGSGALLKASLRKLKAIHEEHNRFMIPMLDLEASRLMESKLNMVFMDIFERKIKQLGVKLTEEERERIKEEVRAELMDALSLFHEMYPKVVEKRGGEVVKVEKEEEKKK